LVLPKVAPEMLEIAFQGLFNYFILGKFYKFPILFFFKKIKKCIYFHSLEKILIKVLKERNVKNEI